MPEDMEKAVENFRRGYDAFNRGDFDEAASYIHPDVEMARVVDVESGLKGREQARQNMEPVVWEKQVLEVHEAEVIGESILLKTTFHAVGRGSGIELDQDGYHLWKVRDGLGVDFRFFLDREDAVQEARAREGIEA